MKIAIFQINVRSGDLEDNYAKILEFWQKAAKLGADLCICPAKVLAGPYLGELGQERQFGKSYVSYLDKLIDQSQNLPPLFAEGHFIAHGENKNLFEDGEIKKIKPIEYQDWQIGYLDTDLGKNSECSLELENGLLKILIMAGDYAFSLDRIGIDLKFWANFAEKTGLIIIAPQIIGGYANAIYSGQSAVFNAKGQCLGLAKSFAEDLLIVDLEADLEAEVNMAKVQYLAEQVRQTSETSANSEKGLEQLWQALVLGVRDFVHKSGASKAILGLSGGIDSALVCAIASEALGAANVMPILLPSPYTSQQSLDDARELINNLQLKSKTLEISSLMQSFQEILSPVLEQFTTREDTLFENLQARIRAVLLTALANRTDALILNTSNKSELAVGYSTLYGDSIGAVSVLGDLYKTQVYQLAKWYNEHREAKIPLSIIEREPTAELRPNQKDSDSLPKYADLDAILKILLRQLSDISICEELNLENKSKDLKDYARVKQLFLNSEFKRRQGACILNVSDTCLNKFKIPLASYLKV